MSNVPRGGGRPVLKWREDAVDLHRKKIGAASIAVRLGVDLRLVVDWLGWDLDGPRDAQIREQYEGLRIHVEKHTVGAGRRQLARRDISRPRAIATSADYIFPE